ncbi:PIN domain-containing protein [Arthrobacter sp. NPDC058127]|uniref:PIN domain-containing protein n=1 Tax=Arthrobacter sp. NPDC058127 TaxID=3346351 RepID=UPI0036E5AC87
MKQHFKGYYASSEEEIRALWSSATIVFDANVLLDFHRYEPETSTTYLRLASAFSDRLWVPFQAVQEYHENRAGVRAGATSAHDEQIDSITKLVNTIGQAPRKSHLAAGEKHKALVDAAKDLLEELKDARATVATRNAPTADDPVLNHLSELLSDDKIGPKPTEEELKKLFKIGAERFANKIPPGYMDLGKKPGNRQYGDYVLWQQVMTHAKENKLDIILVTEDAKEDWWVSAHGKQIMPRPELVNEFREFTNGQSIHLYNGLSFFDYAAEEVGDKTTPEAIKAAREDLEDVAQRRADEALYYRQLREDAAQQRAGEAAYYRQLRETVMTGERFVESMRPVSLAEIGQPAGLGESLPYDDYVRLGELKARLERLIRHISAREEAGTEADDPERSRLRDSLEVVRAELIALHVRAGFGSNEARARIQLFEEPQWRRTMRGEDDDSGYGPDSYYARAMGKDN